MRTRLPARADALTEVPEEFGAYISRLVDRAPPLTSEQRNTLALLLGEPLSPGRAGA
jgi:hypothetical protein